MYTVHFLKDDGKLKRSAKEGIERAVERVYKEARGVLGLAECDILFITNGNKVFPGEYFQESAGDESSLYMFVGEQVNETEQNRVADNLREHLLSGLYTTARSKHIGLDADCGLLEEIVGEGLAGHFMVERCGCEPKSYYTHLSEKDAADIWKKAQQECAADTADIEKWYWGNEGEGIPPLAAFAVGYIFIGKYKEKMNVKSMDLISVSAEDISGLWCRL